MLGHVSMDTLLCLFVFVREQKKRVNKKEGFVLRNFRNFRPTAALGIGLTSNTVRNFINNLIYSVILEGIFRRKVKWNSDAESHLLKRKWVWCSTEKAKEKRKENPLTLPSSQYFLFHYRIMELQRSLAFFQCFVCLRPRKWQAGFIYTMRLLFFSYYSKKKTILISLSIYLQFPLYNLLKYQKYNTKRFVQQSK